MAITDEFGATVSARLLDFFGGPTPWQRRLWSPSVSMMLKEVLEASHAVRSGVLNDDTLTSAVQAASILAGPDPGVGTVEKKRALHLALKKGLVPAGVDYATVKIIIDEVDHSYLERWADALGSANHPSAERTARAIASHLIDAGFSQKHLHRWCTFQLRNPNGAGSLVELVRRAHAMVIQPLKEFSVMVAFEGVPESKSGLPPNWVSANDLSNWLASRNFQTTGLNQNGALLFSVTSRDPWDAVEHTFDVVDQLSARVALGTNSRLIPIQTAWVEGKETTFPFRREPRRAQVHALHREDKLYILEPSSLVGAALHMMGTLNAGPPSTAIAAGWAAIEALLAGPGDPDVVAGHRIGELVVCSFPRAELTELSYKLETEGHALASQISHAKTNRDRAAIVAQAISNGTALNFNHHSDRAAEERIRKILLNPHERLREIKSYVTNAFVRMYKNRNLILHWGKADAVGLKSNLRTIAPLTGAGLDRIAHAWFVENITPMELSARARISLETVGSPGGPAIADLLSNQA